MGTGAGIKVQEAHQDAEKADLEEELENYRGTIESLSAELATQTAKALEGMECQEREDFYFENLKRGDKSGAALAREGRSRRSMYGECNKKQAQTINDARLVVQYNKDEIISRFEERCEELKIYCPEKTTVEKVLYEGMLSYAYCDRNTLSGSSEWGRLRSPASENNPGSFDIRPVTFKYGACAVTDVAVHEWGHVVTGEAHSDGEDFRNDWIYTLGIAASDTCEQRIFTTPTR